MALAIALALASAWVNVPLAIAAEQAGVITEPVAAANATLSTAAESAAEPDDYQTRRFHDPDGTGRFYLGREIAKVVGHRAALWLERPSRLAEEQPEQLIEQLSLQPDNVVADLGAGTGYLSLRLAKQVPEGRVLAVDLQPEMLDLLDFLRAEQQLENVQPILASVADPQLPTDQVDLVLMVDAYHEFAYPREVMLAVVKALKPGGRVVLAEYRGENWFSSIKRLHKMTAQQVKREMAAVGLTWLRTAESLPRQHLFFFEKPGG
ncbi:MAG: class I SAM-dependent methyltransferase [Cyanobacteria bacterium P01_H01_bin.121]